MTDRRLILFDIDGTLIHGGGLWKECFGEAFRRCFPDRTVQWTPFNGKTDGQIALEMIELSGGPRSTDIKAEALEMLDLYLRLAAAEAQRRGTEVKVLPGVHALLDALDRTAGATVGLLTGNFREGARLKLGAVGLHERFELGVYADDHWDRYQLPRIAVERARERTGGTFEGKEVVIIGDTVHDVNCGRSIGVRSIAVGTGRGVNRQELLASGPDHFFEDLGDLEGVLKAIRG